MVDAVSARDLARTAAEEVTRLQAELDEIELLVQQARNEATRHEAKRAQLQERLGQLTAGRPAPPEEIREATNALASATRRASLMEAQVDVLLGKQRVLERFRDRLRFYAEALVGAAGGGDGADGADADAGLDSDPGLSGRAIRDAQEDLRRDIARAMHDGPAQSLTNIALQAQIVQRLVARDTDRAVVEVAQLVAMVQQTLEATKTFIFDVRPMVLDDLGIVPTLRRTARDRGRAARIPVEFDSVGADRRLGADLESALFRIVDDAITGYLATRP
ncbi:MAG TPA: histidine kinase, partial [Candidatus Saccharimonadia bacterium]|nr:histidine kinase [Candidatus Saccharimonadia bacterium]